MKRFYLSVIMVLSLSVAYIMPVYAASGVIGTIGDIENQVQYKRAAGSTWYSAKEGTRLYNNDVVRTLNDSRVTIKLSDGKSIHVPPKTTLTLKADSNTITLDLGKSIYKLAKGQNVAPTTNKSLATAGVMGLQDGAGSSDNASDSSSEEVLQVENTNGQTLSMRDDGSIVDPNAKSKTQEKNGLTPNNNGTVSPYTTPTDAKKQVQDVQNEIKNNVQDSMKGLLFGK